jgi:putative FmdB family regulatory protein
MPLYEYRCPHCAHDTTALVRHGEDEPERCETCGRPGLRRIVSAFNVGGGSAPSERALRYGSRDFLERPERFGETMRALEHRTGVKLSGERLDGAMHRLSEAKKASS